MNNNEGVKYSSHKAPVWRMFAQFKNALEQVALRSAVGHEKYIKTDQDWSNWKRVSNPYAEYSNALTRHLLELGNEEGSMDHDIAVAWNALARLQIRIDQEGNKEDVEFLANDTIEDTSHTMD
jgi:hypothetical protein